MFEILNSLFNHTNDREYTPDECCRSEEVIGITIGTILVLLIFSTVFFYLKSTKVRRAIRLLVCFRTKPKKKKEKQKITTKKEKTKKKKSKKNFKVPDLSKEKDEESNIGSKEDKTDIPEEKISIPDEETSDSSATEYDEDGGETKFSKAKNFIRGLIKPEKENPKDMVDKSTLKKEEKIAKESGKTDNDKTRQ